MNEWGQLGKPAIAYSEPCGFDCWEQLYAGLLNDLGGEGHEHKKPLPL